MVSYFLNQMGPWHIGWYEEQGLTHTVMEPATEIYAKHTGVNQGDLVEIRRITKYIAGGRIDIRDGSKAGYDGWDEYSVELMEQLSWNLFGDFLDELETQGVMTFDELVHEFETSTGHKIVWYDDKSNISM